MRNRIGHQWLQHLWSWEVKMRAGVWGHIWAWQRHCVNKAGNNECTWCESIHSFSMYLPTIYSWLLLRLQLYLKLQSVTFFVQGEYSGAVIQTLLLLPALAETANTTRKYSSSHLCRVRRWIVGRRTVICFQASCKLVLAWLPERASCSFEHKHEVDINLMKELLCLKHWRP